MLWTGASTRITLFGESMGHGRFRTRSRSRYRWTNPYDAQSCAARGLTSAMVLYNLGAVVILGIAGIRSQAVGIALWPAVVLHAGMTVWCVTSRLR